MKLGNKLTFFCIFFYLKLSIISVFAEDKIISTPLLNIEEIKPSFEVYDEKNENSTIQNLKNKKKKNKSELKNLPHAILIGLDKITAKSSEIKINFDEIKKFGPLEIKILKCGKVKINNKTNDIAYMQVKDLSKTDNEKVYIFNGWTFSSDPALTPFDHAIYDLQLYGCFNV
tara:strand:+ start:2355 stop:2870 length:516 start_codon:yes stop_codon:yes gene_type:complete